LPDQLPVDRSGQDGFQVGIILGTAGLRAIELLGGNGLEAWQEIESEQVTKGEGDLAFYMDKSSLTAADSFQIVDFLVYRTVRPRAR
jgi:hypothetical protein